MAGDRNGDERTSRTPVEKTGSRRACVWIWDPIAQRTAERVKKEQSDVDCTDALEWVARSPGYAVLVPALITSLGVMASIFPSAIQASWGGPFFWSGTALNPIGTLFWILVLLGGLLLWGRRAAENRSLDRDERTREQLTENLRDEMRSMPPDSFLNEYKDRLTRIQPILQKVDAIREEVRQQSGQSVGTLEEPSDEEFQSEGYRIEREAIIETIQTLLLAIVQLSHSYDYKRPNQERYAANVLVYIPSTCIPGDRASSVNDRLQHVEREVTVQNLRGILDYRTDLSAVLEPFEEDAASDVETVSGDQAEAGGESSRPRIDINHPMVAFGIPNEWRSNDLGKWRIGPGAPYALLTGEPGLHRNADEIRAWMEEETTLGEDAANRTMNFIEGNAEPHIGSFLSIPLPLSPEFSGVDEAFDPDLPVGVLNVHRPSPGILRGREKSLEYFDITILSLTSQLTHRIEQLARLEFEKHGTWAHLVE